MPRTIFIFQDGTGNDIFAQNQTNVAILAELLLPNPNNIVLYYPGPGVKDSNTVLSEIDQTVVDGLIASSLLYKVRVIYKDLCFNYLAGDKIYFFGFSRGSVIVRFLTCYIKYFGIIKKEHFSAERLIKQSSWYMSKFPSVKGYGPEIVIKFDQEITKDFPNLNDTNHINLTIDFVGIFDTVPGQADIKDLKVGDIFYYGQTFIKNFAHIMANSETVEYQDFSYYIFPNEKWNYSQNNCKWVIDNDHEYEIRFPGDHCNCGGGWASKPENNKLLSNTSLRIMIARTERAAGRPLFAQINDKYPQYTKDTYPEGIKSVLNFKDMNYSHTTAFEYIAYHTVALFYGFKVRDPEDSKRSEFFKTLFPEK